MLCAQAVDVSEGRECVTIWLELEVREKKNAIQQNLITQEAYWCNSAISFAEIDTAGSPFLSDTTAMPSLL